MIKIVLKIIRQRYKNCANRQIFLQKMARMVAGLYPKTLIRHNSNHQIMNSKHCKGTKLSVVTQISEFDIMRCYVIF